MLQQILHDMYVDPEILAELDEDQKQTLFCKMREEQIRRWKNWTDKLGDEPVKQELKTANKKVNFLLGMDGEPWVWVMGEHKDDRTIEEILRKEASKEARKLAEKETEKLREEVRKEMKAQLIEDYVDLTPKIEENLPKLSLNDDMDIYCSVEEIRSKMHSKSVHYTNSNNNNNNYSLIDYPSKISKKIDNSPEQKSTQKVSQKVALWEQKLLSDKTSEIFQKIQIKQQQCAKEAEEEENMKELEWREQERKAKEAEHQIREIARRAREEHKLNSSFHIDTPLTTVNLGVPPGRNAVIEWYRSKERKRFAALDSSNNVMPWFHGLITRQEAERLLLDQPCGTFLVRLSEKIWGYVISYRAQEKCKHYLVNAEQNYIFVGNNQKEYDSLGDVISFHEKFPLTGGETLQYPCPRNSASALEELFKEI